MDDRQSASDLINIIGTNPREWGKHMWQLLPLLVALSESDWCSVKSSTLAESRYNVMYQYLGHIRRNYTNTIEHNTIELVNNAITLILLEGFEFDYRETTRLVSSFLKDTDASLERFLQRAHDCDASAIAHIRGIYPVEQEHK